MKQPTAAPDASWEKIDCPKVTLAGVMVPATIFAAWMAFLMYFAIARWTGSLQ